MLRLGPKTVGPKTVGETSWMSLRRTSATLWLAALVAVAAGACATSAPAAAPAASAPVAAPKPAAPAATAPAAKPAAFGICSACHGTTANAPPGLGPNLFGVVGRKAGTAADFDYSTAMKAYGKVWTTETLAAFVLDPSKEVPGNKMDYDGAADAATARAIADYMASLK